MCAFHSTEFVYFECIQVEIEFIRKGFGRVQKMRKKLNESTNRSRAPQIHFLCHWFEVERSGSMVQVINQMMPEIIELDLKANQIILSH